MQRVMRRLGYRMVSSDHDQGTRGGAANHILSQQASKRNQINQIWMKKEHASMATRVKVDWAPTAWRHNKYHDHAMMMVRLQIDDRQVKRRRDRDRIRRHRFILGSWLETARTSSWTRMVLSAPHTFALVSPGSFEDASLAVRMGGVAARPHR